MNSLLIIPVVLLVAACFVIVAAIFQQVNKWFKVQSITYVQSLYILLSYLLVQGFFKGLSVFVSGFSGLINLVGFILAIFAAYFLYRKYTSVGISKFILISIVSGFIGTVIAIFAVVVIRLYIFQPFVVSGDSMVPAYTLGDYLIIEEWDKSVKKGDVVIAAVSGQGGSYYVIARVIGVPGDTINDVQVTEGNYYLGKDNSTATEMPGLIPMTAIVGKPLLDLGHVDF